MVGAALVHVRSHETEYLPNPLVLGAIAAAITTLRFGPYSF
jgi:hypothetical protein